MKYYTSICFIFCVFFAKAQHVHVLKDLGSFEKFPKGKAVIYGKFIQRLGKESISYPQYIRIINLDTKEIYSFCVKQDFSGSKEDLFCVIVRPGNYAIYNYCWSKYFFIETKTFFEPIYKNVDATKNIKERLKSGELKESDLVQYSFKISENSVNYMGSWHFDTGLVSFTNDKEELDKKIQRLYKRVDFSSANIVLPN